MFIKISLKDPNPYTEGMYFKCLWAAYSRLDKAYMGPIGSMESFFSGKNKYSHSVTIGDMPIKTDWLALSKGPR